MAGFDKTGFGGQLSPERIPLLSAAAAGASSILSKDPVAESVEAVIRGEAVYAKRSNCYFWCCGQTALLINLEKMMQDHVYSAQYPETGETVVIKKMASKADPELLYLQNLGRFSQGPLKTLEINNDFYAVMKYLGNDLYRSIHAEAASDRERFFSGFIRDRIRDRGSMERSSLVSLDFSKMVQITTRIFYEICLGVDELFKDCKKIPSLQTVRAHADLKTQNICFQGTKAFVIDIESLTFEGGDTRFGTREYMPPERCKAGSTGAATLQSDIYALGLIVYEIWNSLIEHFLSDRKLMARSYPEISKSPDLVKEWGGSFPEFLGSDISRCPEFLESLRTGVVRLRSGWILNTGVTYPEELINLISRCLEKEPGDRPSSIKEIIDVLKPLLGIASEPEEALALAGETKEEYSDQYPPVEFASAASSVPAAAVSGSRKPSKSAVNLTPWLTASRTVIPAAGAGRRAATSGDYVSPD